MDLFIRAQREIWNDTIALNFAEKLLDDKKIGIANPVTFTKQDKDTVFAKPCIRLNQTAAQRLMDELWSCGVRPSEGTGSAGSLAATERHLQDMKTIAMGLVRKFGKFE